MKAFSIRGGGGYHLQLSLFLPIKVVTLVPKHSVRPILVYFEKIRNEKKFYYGDGGGDGWRGSDAL